MTISYFVGDNGDKLAYVHVKASSEGEKLPAVMFLGGFKSDMEGTKALYLEQQCRARGQEFLRFDYSGHGKSSGEFVDGTIGAWKKNAMDMLDNIIERDVIPVGSSMGGWIALLLALEGNMRIKAVVGIAAAPDFTKDIEDKMGQDERDMMARLGRLEVPNDYSDDPYIFTSALLEDGNECSVLDKTHDVSVPITLIQGKRDNSVEWGKALDIKECFKGSEVEVIFIDDGDHSLSRDQDLALINKAVMKL